jgi:mannose-1-phosphate guanylyltransferase
MTNNYCVIMAGGIGSRFWPMSRNSFPKQFLDILGTGRTLLQATYDRFTRVCPPENIFIVTHHHYRNTVLEQLPQVNALQIIGEPQRRNTAPCVAYASYKISRLNPDANMVVAPSDHIILKEEAFVESIKHGLEFTAKNDCLLTLGIKPNRPDTGYGYIQFVEDGKKDRIKKVKTFTEKPNLEMAKFFLQSGEFVWNSGIFLWNFNSIQKALKQFLPEHDALFSEGLNVYNTAAEEEFIQKAYAHVTNISIDFGVMEKAKNVYVMAADFGWSDLGTWGSLFEHIPKDANQNAVVGKHVMMYDSRSCIVHVPKDKLVVLQGLDDYIVVESNDVLLVCRKEDEQQIRQFVNDVKMQKGEKFV